ncbi:MAG TPA: hypothetical protein VMS31_14185 [Pyrinomonadaceae bacterium]|nr:hypothetical protein [Pyrinomonadaceae bacterium]
MQESKGSAAEHDNQEPGGDSEATSKEQLSDIEDNESDVESGSSQPDPGPSPDGALDESDEIKDAGPM